MEPESVSDDVNYWTDHEYVLRVSSRIVRPLLRYKKTPSEKWFIGVRHIKGLQRGLSYTVREIRDDFMMVFVPASIAWVIPVMPTVYQTM